MEHPVIVIDPDVMNGTPCFRGTRVPFKNRIDYLEGGYSLGEFLRQFPTVTREMAIQALEGSEGLIAGQNRMRILLDECLPLDFRHSFSSHEAHTVQWAGFKGKKNGELLLAAEIAGYNVLLTVDQGMPHQHPVGR
ncbi:MAG: DUF433 domain-containing protein [Acidobacteriia bacterium]|nr:DUF433 domain-containing protein [Terriglobia bacterium]